MIQLRSYICTYWWRFHWSYFTIEDVKFTLVKEEVNEFCHMTDVLRLITMVNFDLVSCADNGGMMKGLFTIVKLIFTISKAGFVNGLSKFCLLWCQVVMYFEKFRPEKQQDMDCFLLIVSVCSFWFGWDRPKTEVHSSYRDCRLLYCTVIGALCVLLRSILNFSATAHSDKQISTIVFSNAFVETLLIKLGNSDLYMLFGSYRKTE